MVNVTCIECPMGCPITVELNEGKIVSIKGNSCPRGKLYAENEIVCPVRVVTSSIRAENGTMVSVKTDKPVRKSEIFLVMQKINSVSCSLPVRIGDVLLSGITEGVNLIATCNA